MTNNRCVGIRQICQFQVKQKTSFKKIRDGKKIFFCQNIVSYAKTFEKSALASFLHYVRVTLTHQPHVVFLAQWLSQGRYNNNNVIIPTLGAPYKGH